RLTASSTHRGSPRVVTREPAARRNELTSDADLPNLTVSGANGVDDVYRDTGGSGIPLVLLQHFRGHLDKRPFATSASTLALGRVLVAVARVQVSAGERGTPESPRRASAARGRRRSAARISPRRRRVWRGCTRSASSPRAAGSP